MSLIKLGDVRKFNWEEFVAVSGNPDSCLNCVFSDNFVNCQRFQWEHSVCQANIIWRRLNNDHSIDLVIRAVKIAYPSAPELDPDVIKNAIDHINSTQNSSDQN